MYCMNFQLDIDISELAPSVLQGESFLDLLGINAVFPTQRILFHAV